jgi:hypothetical protein
MTNVLPRAEIAQRALEIYLGGFKPDAIVETMHQAVTTWRHHYGPDVDLKTCAPLALMSAVLLYEMTGVLVFTEDTAHKWVRECQILCDSSDIKVTRKQGR